MEIVNIQKQLILLKKQKKELLRNAFFRINYKKRDDLFLKLMTDELICKSIMYRYKSTVCKYKTGVIESKIPTYYDDLILTFETHFYKKYNPIIYIDTLNLFPNAEIVHRGLRHPTYILKLNNGSFCYYFENCNDKSKRFNSFYSIYDIIFNKRFSKKEESKILEECASRYYIFTKKAKALNIIKNGLHNYLWAPKCKDGTVGLIPRIAWRNIQKLTNSG